MARAATVVVREGAVAVIRRVRRGRTFYLFPGGQIEDGETAEQCAVRETREELGLDVRLGRLLASVSYRGREQRYFDAEVLGGEFGSGDGAELALAPSSERGSYTPIWLPLDELARHDVRPAAVAKALADGSLTRSIVPLWIVEPEREQAA